ncbi:MAG: hypothetical protein JNJ57_17085 [Saprospiraceae bacterium]|nr:hypothetical protein [Saprospiraceae bacterium]
MFPSNIEIVLAADKTLPELGSGAYQKQVVVLALAEPESPVNKSFLDKVFAAANLDLGKDTLYVEVDPQTPINCFAGVSPQPLYIIVFGLPMVQVGIKVQAQFYQPFSLSGTTWLFADPVSVLEPNRDKKGQLWAALKNLFLGKP